MDDWDDASISEVTVETRFADSEQWWQWLWSHGMRALLEMLPEDVLPSAREAAFEVMESARTPAGDFAIHTDIRVTTAKR